MAPAAKGPKPQSVPRTPSNAIHIATSSIDGNVCVYSLVDSDDVILRKFGRPLQSVALSPNFRNDRSYLSGGKAGSLVLTVGGKAGKTEAANINGIAAASANWLDSMGLGGHSGTDTVLHSSEGSISTIKWSLSGRYVVWVNEYGIKIMRSSLGLESGEMDYAWKRINHVDRPNRTGWEEMSGESKARAESIKEVGQLAANGTTNAADDAIEAQSVMSSMSFKKAQRSFGREKLLVGWGGTIWIMHVHPPDSGGKNASERKIGRVEIVSMCVPGAPGPIISLTLVDYELMASFPAFRFIPLVCLSLLCTLIRPKTHPTTKPSAELRSEASTGGKMLSSQSSESSILRARKKVLRTR